MRCLSALARRAAHQPMRTSEKPQWITCERYWMKHPERRVSQHTMKLIRHIVPLALLVSALNAQSQNTEPVIELKTTADYLALHVSGKAPSGTTALLHRLGESGGIADSAAWVALATAPSADGALAFDVPLKTSRWSELQVRAMKGEEVLATKETHHKADAFEMLTPERIAALPEPDRTAWASYMKRSIERAKHEFDVLAAECRKLGLATSKPAPSNRAEFELDSDTEESWFASAEAQKVADAIISYQTPSGGWSKAVDYTAGARQPGTHWTTQDGEGWHYCGTLDNRTTTEQIKMLAEVFAATKREDAKAAALRGIDYLLEAQFPNGGWPQNYPVESGYHEAITLNDNAMAHVLEVLLAIVQQSAPLGFADDTLRQRAQAAFDKGIACLAAAQVKVDGKPTVWCAQHDPLTLAPAAARLKEPPALSGGESTELLRFFMRKAPITPQITAMIEPALAWLEAHRITGLRKTKNAAGKTDYIADAASTEIYWARFYDVQSGRPMFAGAQDGIVYSTFTEMAAKNKVGYDYFTTKPGDVIGKEIARWKKRADKENK